MCRHTCLNKAIENLIAVIRDGRSPFPRGCQAFVGVGQDLHCFREVMAGLQHLFCTRHTPTIHLTIITTTREGTRCRRHLPSYRVCINRCKSLWINAKGIPIHLPPQRST